MALALAEADRSGPFDRVPNEIIEHVAFFTATLGPLGPPTDLIALQLVSRRFSTALSTRTNPHFYVLIFKAKFDADAYFRRLGPAARTSENVVKELKRRCALLTRFRGLQHCFAQAQQPTMSIPRMSGPAAIPSASPRANLAAAADANEEEEESGRHAAEETLKTKDMLWMAYLMMLENDGLNERTLRGYARLDVWLRNFWFDPEGASFATYAIGDNLWPPNMEFSVLAMWLFWFLLKPGMHLFHHHYSIPFLCSSRFVRNGIDMVRDRYITDDYFALDELAFRSVVSILKLIALGAMGM